MDGFGGLSGVKTGSDRISDVQGWVERWRGWLYSWINGFTCCDSVD